ncbi:MAG: lycopene cyclase domain-containing protein [Bacteroidota bacterium]
MNSLYLLIDFFTILVPFLFSFHPKLRFYKHWKAFFISNVLVAIIFLLWDSIFVKLGVWGFNKDYILGINIINLPIEEVLFFICIPFSCVFTFHCLNIFFSFHWRSKTESIFVAALCLLLLMISIIHHDRYYTVSTFASLALVLFLLKFILKVNLLAKLFSIYPILLIPFFIVNGILTGTGISSPVVWYNDHENIGIRMLTIPIEDIFYGFELILLNISLYEYLKTKFIRQTP